MTPTIDRKRRVQALLPLATICFPLLIGVCPILGQTPLTDMYHRSWTVRDGAPNGIEDGVQGPDGFLWFTTDDGLYRFDGVTFERYQPPPGHSLVSDRMHRILVAHDGAIWISYMNAGVTRIQGDQITNFTEENGLRPGHTGELAEDKEGRVWVAGAAGLQFIQNNHVTPFTDENGVGKSWSEAVVVDSDGNVWLPQLDEGVKVLERGSRNFIVVSRKHFFGCNPARDAGVLCQSHEDPVTHFTVFHAKIVSRPLTLRSEIEDVLDSRDGTLWSGNKNGIQRLRDRSEPSFRGAAPAIETFGRNSGLSGDPGILFEDREGSTWVITDRGIDQFRVVPFQNLPIDAPYITLPSSRPGSRFLIATDRLAEVIHGKVSYLSKAGEAARCLYQADDGTVWIGGWGLSRYRKGRLEDVPLPIPHSDSVRSVITVVEDSSHGIWANVGTRGLYRLDSQGWSRRGGLTGLPDAGAYAALRQSDGDLWFGFRKNILARISSGKVSVFDASKGLDVGDIRVLTERNGSVWIGGDRGIAVFDHGSFRSVALSDGNRLRDVSGLVFLSNGDLWINSSSGVFQITHGEVAKWDHMAEYPLRWRLFDYLDGLNGIPELFSGNPTAAVASDGMLYVTPALTLQRIDPLHIPNNPIVPQVFITKVSTVEGVRPLSDDIHLQPDTRGLEINYTATSLLIPERVRFRYQLVGYDRDWIDAGKKRQAFYPKVPAGTYTFRVIACNDSGLWSPSGTSVTLTVAPTWIETVWFKLGVALIVAALLYLGFLVRMRIMKRKVTERLIERFAERERIARDLHDTLFQGVEGGLLHINAVTSRLTLEPAAKDQLHSAFHELNQVMASARNLIFNQRKPAESLAFEEIIAAHAQQAGLLSASRFAVTTSGKKREIKAAVREELLKIVKESLSNAFRHANAKEIQVQIVYSRSTLEICVRDDGTGIDPIILEEGGRRGHWGLSSMRQRSAQVGGTLIVSRRQPRGTEVLISIPASRAFRSHGFELAAKWIGRSSNVTDTPA